jgi:hypothetical protein
MAVRVTISFGRLVVLRTLGTDTTFQGNILALTSITLDTGATIACGRALAENGAVTMDSNLVSIDQPGCENSGTSTPEPSSLPLLATGLGLLAISGLVLRCGRT